MNTDVRRIQSALSRASFTLNVTGIWDTATCQALLGFQAAKYGSSKQNYLDGETFMDLGFDAKTADRLEASYGHICGGVDVAPSQYGNTVGKGMSPVIKRIQRALRLKETGKLDANTCMRLTELAKNQGSKALITKSGLERLGFTSTEAAAFAGQFAFAQCTARGRAVVAGVGLAYPGFSGFAGADADAYDQCDAYGQCDQDPEEDWNFNDTCEDPADIAAVWSQLLPAGHHWCTAAPSGLAIVNDWIIVDQSCNGVKRRQWSSNNGEAYYQFWRTLTNEERWACPKQTVTPRRTQLIKLMQEVLIDLDYDLGKYGADGKPGEMTCKAAMYEQHRLGMCGQQLLQKGFFESLGFSSKEVQDAWNEISGICRGYYTGQYDCKSPTPPPEPPLVPVTPPPPPDVPPKPQPVKPATCSAPALPSGMAWCSGQPAGATMIAKAQAVTSCAGWTKEVWQTADKAQHVKFYNAAAKSTKWACAKNAPAPIPDDKKKDEPIKTEKAGWIWWAAGAVLLLGGAAIYSQNKSGSPSRARSRRR
jgi:hypothetical protein